MRVTTITTLRHNIGDDYVREGIMYLVDRVLGHAANYQHIHKHAPITVRPYCQWLYDSGLIRQLDRLPKMPGLRLSQKADSILPKLSDKISNADCVIQAGAPIYWKNAFSAGSQAEWIDPIIRRRVAALRKPFLNIAGGTCLGYHSNGEEVINDASELEFVRWYADVSRLTTVRDQISMNILDAANRPGLLLPCTSLFARDRWKIQPAEPKYIVLNIMQKGGHYNLEGDIDSDTWASTFKMAVAALRKMQPCLVVCHTVREQRIANALCPGIPTFYSRRFSDYFEVFSRARFGIVNRVHAAFAMASFGRPSFVVGNDTRAHMVSLLNLRHAYINDIRAESILHAAEILEQHYRTYGDFMEQLRNKTRAEYHAALDSALTPSPQKALI